MTKKEKEFYYKLGQAVSNICGAIMFFAIPIAGCILGEYIINIIL